MSDDVQASGSTGGISRRGFLATGAVAAAGLVFAPSYAAGFARTSGYVQGAGPNSKFGGVQIGAITYSFRSLPGANDPEQVLSYLVLAGISSTELMGEPILRYLGAPTSDAPNPSAISRITDPAQREAATRQRAAFDAELARWYASPPMEKVAALKKLYNDAGVSIHLTKLNAGSPAAAEFAFQVSRALGARGNSAEISEETARMQGPIALRHSQTANLHNHGQPGDPKFVGFDRILAISPGVSLNLDIGHYYGSTGKSPVPEIIRLNQRITSFHLKDRAAPVDGGENMPWGQGGTPIAEVLRLVNRERYNINADIEMEYEVPADSNALLEVRKSVEFCREVLTRASAPAR
jgi:sugar phosphate isomerase/epimerase